MEIRNVRQFCENDERLFMMSTIRKEYSVQRRPAGVVPFSSCYENVRRDLEYHYQQKAIYKQILRRYEKYKGMKLRRKSCRGRSYYSVLMQDTTVKYLGKENHPMVQRLKLRDYYTKCLRDLETNIRCLEAVLKNYKPIDPNVRIEHMKKVQAVAVPEIFENAKVIDARAWAAAAYPRIQKHPEHLIHKTMRGEYVRSKSEVIIANALYQAGIPYRYEQITEFAGIVIAADFIVLSVRHHKLFVWEHFGRMKDPQYQKDYLWKLRQYTKAGFVVGLDLLTTFDDVDGAIDTVTVRRYIEEVIL